MQSQKVERMICMNIQESVLTCINKYFDFTGRARRSEYWWFILAVYVVDVILTALGRKIGIFNVLASLVSLALLIPSLAVNWRRMHDVGRSGAWFFINFLPIIGNIIYLVFAVQDSQPGSNQYGPNPKGN